MAKPFDEDVDQGNESGEDSDSSEDIIEPVAENDETSSSGSSTDEEDPAGEVTESNDLRIIDILSHSPNLVRSPTDLKSRLACFIPQIQQANAALETDPEAATKQIDRVDDGEERYIEMNLGLGVLKEKARSGIPGVKTTVSDGSESSDDFSDDGTSVSEGRDEAGDAQIGIVDKLKGIKSAKRKIEEVS